MGKITFGKMDTFEGVQECYICLLYTSDAADE